MVSRDRALHPKHNALRKCAEWLIYCLHIGWPKESLDRLEELWWEHHDEYGNLTAK